MTNEQILNKRWKNIDKYLVDYLKKYNDINQDMKYEIQDLFDSLNISYSDINKPISKSKKDRLDKFILKLQKDGLLSDYFGYRARLILNKKKVTYSELLEIMIMSSYIKQNKSFDEYNNILFFNVCETAYNQGIGDIVKIKDVKPKSFKLPILYTLLNIPILNMTAESYLYSLALTNADELYKQTLINLQLGKELDVDSKFYKNLFDKQNKRYININGEKISGGIVNIVENLTNLAYLQAGIDTDVKQCRFIAEMDKRTTKMCETLNNQLFKLNEMNVYQRYSEIDKKTITYHTKGLVQGENLPPITNHFHWCRSTITYLIDKDVIKRYKDITKQWLKIKRVNNEPQLIKLSKGDTFKYHGKEYVVDNKKVKYTFNSKELKFAEWLANKKQIDIQLNPTINEPEGISTADLTINNDYYDMKIISGKGNQVIYHNIYGKEKQSHNFLFEATSSQLSLSELVEQINKVYLRTDVDWVKIIGIKKDDEFIIFERR